MADYMKDQLDSLAICRSKGHYFSQEGSSVCERCGTVRTVAGREVTFTYPTPEPIVCTQAADVYAVMRIADEEIDGPSRELFDILLAGTRTGKLIVDGMHFAVTLDQLSFGKRPS
jgi:hypothetical protein